MSLDKEYFDISNWLPSKLKYHKNSAFRAEKSKLVQYGEVWMADMGFNIGDEKNKIRPIAILSNNRVNNSAKVIGACITDAKDKIDLNGKPKFNSWFLLYTTSKRNKDKYRSNRIIPRNAISYGFLRKDSVIQMEEIRSISKARLLYKIGTLNSIDMPLIKIKLKKVFDI